MKAEKCNLTFQHFWGEAATSNQLCSGSSPTFLLGNAQNIARELYNFSAALYEFCCFCVFERCLPALATLLAQYSEV